MNAKVFLTRETAEKMQAMCAWVGCPNCCSFDNLPNGWRNLLIWVDGGEAKPLQMIGEAAMYADWDTVLCPEHFTELDGLLKPRRSRSRE